MGIDKQNLLIASLLTLNVLVNTLGFADFKLVFLKIALLSIDSDSNEMKEKF